MFFHNQLSIVVPVGVGDLSFARLARDLSQSGFMGEIIFVFSLEAYFKPSQPLKSMMADHSMAPLQIRIRYLVQSGSRAQKMNAGAVFAGGQYLWFLHADTRLSQVSLERLARNLEETPGGLHFFDIRFLTDGPIFMKINELGVKFRSCCLGIPFGDQGFCLSRQLFLSLNGYPEDVPYGEDHVFVWMLRRQGHQLHRVPSQLQTSARKYRKGGWFKTTVEHVYKTAIQAAPHALNMTKQKFSRLMH